MGKLVIDGNKVYSVDEACMKRKNLTLEQIRAQKISLNGESQNSNSQGRQDSQGQTR